MSAIRWRERLLESMPSDLAEEIDIFEGQMQLRRRGAVEDRVFAETRLRRGVYGQRYDNGQRHDGVASQRLEFPAGDLTKGPETLWDAPGMQRIKIPFGGITPEQLEVMAELAEEYSDGILHVTTRQDVQLHYVHIDDTPDADAPAGRGRTSPPARRAATACATSPPARSPASATPRRST